MVDPHPIDDIIIDGSEVQKTDVRTFVRTRTRIRCEDANEIRNTDFSGQFGGLAIGGAFYDLDIDDTTSLDDGANVIIDAAGNRFKIVNADMLSELTWTIDGGNTLILPGEWGHQEVPFDCQVSVATILGSAVGSIVIDVWRQTYAQFLAGAPSSANSICGISPANKPTIISARASKDAVLSGWTKTLNKGDILTYNVDSITGLVRVTLSLALIKSIPVA